MEQIGYTPEQCTKNGCLCPVYPCDLQCYVCGQLVLDGIHCFWDFDSPVGTIVVRLCKKHYKEMRRNSDMALCKTRDSDGVTVAFRLVKGQPVYQVIDPDQV